MNDTGPLVWEYLLDGRQAIQFLESALQGLLGGLG